MQCLGSSSSLCVCREGERAAQSTRCKKAVRSNICTPLGTEARGLHLHSTVRTTLGRTEHPSLTGSPWQGQLHLTAPGIKDLGLWGGFWGWVFCFVFCTSCFLAAFPYGRKEAAAGEPTWLTLDSAILDTPRTQNKAAGRLNAKRGLSAA